MTSPSSTTALTISRQTEIGELDTTPMRLASESGTLASKSGNSTLGEKVKSGSGVQQVHNEVEIDHTGNPVAFDVPKGVPRLRLAGPHTEPPKELAKMALPKYRLEPPDVLLLDVLRLVPKAPYTIEPFDVLEIVAPGSDPEFPLADFFQVEPSGRVNLGARYGAVKVAGKTLKEATNIIQRHLAARITSPEVSVSIAQFAGQQLISGEHLVGPDGYLNLGTYGGVYVSGMTLDEAREAIETHLSEFLEDPKISLDVYSYNSKVFYVIAAGAGLGETVIRLPITGNETVLDAISMVGGIGRVSNPRKIWIARPAPSGVGCDQILPVNWKSITAGGTTATNYQVLPGDRIYIAEDRMIRLESTIQKLTAPFERMLGFSLLGGQTIQLLQRFPEGRFQGGFF